MTTPLASVSLATPPRAALRIEPRVLAQGPRVLTSIHDVSPASLLEVQRLWALCRACGATPALLVVPNWHGAWPIDEHPGFVGWLRARVHDGAQVMLHGFRHDEVGTRRTWRDAWRAWGRTDREGEFLTLGAREARQRLADGIAVLRGVGVEPIGFVPPAWLMRAEILSEIGRAGLRLAEDAAGVYVIRSARPMLHPAAQRVRAPTWRWSARSPARAVGSAAMAESRTLHAMLRRASAAIGPGETWRVALHPRDVTHPATHWSVGRTLERVARMGRFARYTELLGGPSTLGGVDDG